MPEFHVPDAGATTKIEITGLAACCFNASYQDPGGSGRVGRWEIALPREDHQLAIETDTLGTLNVPEVLKKIEIKDRVGVKVDNPKHLKDPFDRQKPKLSNKYDYRWLTDFTDASEIPHTNPTMVAGSNVTMLYVYDATCYTELEAEPTRMSLTPHDNTGLIKDEGLVPAPDYLAGPVLDNAAYFFGFVARSIIFDVHPPERAQGVVDIFLGTEILTTINQGTKPFRIDVSNMEAQGFKPPGGGTVETAAYKYGRGDFYRYYKLFRVPSYSPKFHLWSRTDRNPGDKVSSSGDPARTGDCNGVRVDSFANLDGLL